MLDSVQYGRSGLSVSRLCLGTMNYGGRCRPARPLDPIPRQRTADLQGRHGSGPVLFRLRQQLRYGCVGALSARYSGSSSRASYVLSTKLIMPMAKGPNQGGLSRKHVMEEIDAILTRLGLDYVDQLVVHRHPSVVPNTPPPPLKKGSKRYVVKAGQSLYIGASSMYTW